jgi:hypothetical protein
VQKTHELLQNIIVVPITTGVGHSTQKIPIRVWPKKEKEIINKNRQRT